MQTQLKALSPERQARVMWLHHEVFSGDVACRECPGNCCINCGKAGAYIGKALTPELKEKYGWHDQLGFSGEHGCKLPINERSDVCLSFACSGVNAGSGDIGLRPPPGVSKPFTQGQRELLNEMVDVFIEHEETQRVIRDSRIDFNW